MRPVKIIVIPSPLSPLGILEYFNLNRIADIDNTISNPDIFVEVVLGFGVALGLGVLFKFSPVIFHRLKLLGIIKSKKQT